jgi:hypothetical protein
MVEVLQSEYESIRSEITETYKQPERWAAILAGLTIALVALYQANAINFINREYILYCSGFPMVILIAIIYYSKLTMRKLFKTRIDIASEIKQRSSSISLSKQETDLLNECSNIYMANLNLLGWLILLYVLAMLIFFYKAMH